MILNQNAMSLNIESYKKAPGPSDIFGLFKRLEIWQNEFHLYFEAQETSLGFIFFRKV